MARMRLKDIAAEAGVSPATASKYLNGHYEAMSAATRDRIAEVVERTGYRPSSVARNLRLDRTRTLGIVLADIRNPYSSAMLEELSAQAADGGYSLTCAISGNDPAKETDALERLCEAGVDGLIVNTCGGNDEQLMQLNRRLPIVLLDRDVEHGDGDLEQAGLDLVTSNNAELVSALVREVSGAAGADAGERRRTMAARPSRTQAKAVRPSCTRIHLLTEGDSSSSIRRERALTFMRELSAQNLAGSTLALPTDAREAAKQLVELADAYIPLGLIAINGLVFQRLVEAIALSGLLVPERLRIATFDEYSWNRVLFGGVTTAAQDTHAIASTALDRITTRIASETTAGNNAVSEGDAETWRCEIPGTIIPRASTR